MATFRGPIRLLAAKEIGSFDVPTVGPIIDKPDNSPADHTVTIAVVTVLLSILLIVGVVVGVKYVCLRRSSRSRIPDAEDEQGDDEISLQFALQDLQPPTHNDSGGTRVVITPGSSGSSRVSPLHGTPNSQLSGISGTPTRRPVNDFTRALCSNPITRIDLNMARIAGRSGFDGQSTMNEAGPSQQPQRVPPRRQVGRPRRGNPYPPPAGRRLKGPRRCHDAIPESIHEHTCPTCPLSPPVTLSIGTQSEVASQELTIPVSESEPKIELPVSQESAQNHSASPVENPRESSTSDQVHVTFAADPFGAPLRDQLLTPMERTVLRRRRHGSYGSNGFLSTRDIESPRSETRPLPEPTGRFSEPQSPMERAFTNASLVPEPLHVGKRPMKHRSMHVSSSSRAINTENNHLVVSRSSSATDVDGLTPDPEVFIERPRSFVNDWPTPPSDDRLYKLATPIDYNNLSPTPSPTHRRQ